MTTDLDGIPSGLASVEASDASVSIRVDAAVYPIDALYGAAYVFIDRCYVLLDKPDGPDGGWRVTLATKTGEPTSAPLRALAGEFANELLSCAWRSVIAHESRAMIESVTSRALAGAMGPPSLEDLASYDFGQEVFEDPLGIALSWEERHKKKARADDPGDVPATAPSTVDEASREGRSVSPGVYSDGAVAEAVTVFAPHATLERHDEASHWVVEVSAATPRRERRVAGELGNYALGLTVKGRGR